jgi:hypothetical protein
MEARNNDPPVKEWASHEGTVTDKESIVEEGVTVTGEHPNSPGVKSSTNSASPTRADENDKGKSHKQRDNNPFHLFPSQLIHS